MTVKGLERSYVVRILPYHTPYPPFPFSLSITLYCKYPTPATIPAIWLIILFFFPKKNAL